MKIYTKTGDSGFTSLLGGIRVPKNDIRIEAYGTVDELISYIGLIRDQDIKDKTKSFLLYVQDLLMRCAAIIASGQINASKKLPDITEDNISELEKQIDKINDRVAPLNSFILPGGHPIVSYCHIARTVCRRAERNYLKVAEKFNIDPNVLKFINRLSDYLFMIARQLGQELKVVEIPWNPKVGND